MSLIRKATMNDVQQIYQLYKTVSRHNPGDLTQEEDEITLDYVEEMIKNSLARGLVLITEKDNQIIGYVKAFTSKFRCLAHVLDNITLMIHPNYQNNNGYGAKLAIKFLDEIKINMPYIFKLEIVPHKSNQAAIKMYYKLGFKVIVSNPKKIRNLNGSFEDELLMSWLNPNFSEQELDKYYIYLSKLINIDKANNNINKTNQLFIFNDTLPLFPSIHNIQQTNNRLL